MNTSKVKMTVMAWLFMIFFIVSFSQLVFARTDVCFPVDKCNWSEFSTWAPTAGRIWLEHEYGENYILHNNFIWTKKTGFKENSISYEHSIVLKNHDFLECRKTVEKTYMVPSFVMPPIYGFDELKDMTTIDCKPTSVIHNFESKLGFYVDTRAEDEQEGNGRDFGFGILEAEHIVLNKEYYVDFLLKTDNNSKNSSRVSFKPSLTHVRALDNTCVGKENSLPTGISVWATGELIQKFCYNNREKSYLGKPQACMFETPTGCLNIIITGAKDGKVHATRAEFQKGEDSPVLPWCMKGISDDWADDLADAEMNSDLHLKIPGSMKVDLLECNDVDWIRIKPERDGIYRLSLDVPKGSDFDFYVYKYKDSILDLIMPSFWRTWTAANKANFQAGIKFTTSNGEEKDSFYDDTQEIAELTLFKDSMYYVKFVSNASWDHNHHGGWYGQFKAELLKSTLKTGAIVTYIDGSKGVVIHSEGPWWLIFWDNEKTELSLAFRETERMATSEELGQACIGYFKYILKKKYKQWSYSALKKLCREGLGVGWTSELVKLGKSLRRTRRDNTPAHFPVTRSQYVKLVSEALEVNNSDKPFRTPTQQPFNDVLLKDQFAPYIQYAKDKGIIQGCGEGNFCPDEYITKAEGIKIVIAGFKDKFAKIFNAFSNGKEPVHLFNDVTDKSAWFYPYVYTAKESHLLHGYKDNSFKPNELMSRANMAKVVCIAAFGPMECSNMGDTDRSVVFAVTPDTATVNELVTFTIEGLSMPIPVTLAIPDCANLTPVSGGTAEKQDFQCTPTLAGLKNATVNAPDGTVLVEFAVEVKDISTPPPPPSCTPSVTAVSPLTAVLNQTQVFTVKGLCLPETTVFSIAECDDLARLDGDEQQQRFRCLPNSTGDKPGVVKDEPEGTVLHDFTVSVTEDSSTTTPTPLEGDGLVHDDYRPGDATQLFILNDTMTTTCTFSDVDQSSEFAEAVNALCSAGILVGYWENDERVFIKLDPDDETIPRNDPANKMTKAILAEILKVFLFAVNYDYFGVRHVNDSDTWYELFIDEATNKGLDLHDLAYNNHVTRGQAMTWLAQLFYNDIDSDPIGFLKTQGITSGERLDEALTRYELAALTYNAILDTGKTDEIHFGLFDAPAPKLPSSNFAQSVANQALAAVGQTYPYVDSQYTYSARFVRTQFEKRVKWPDAKSLCQHYDDLGVMETSETPPAGAVICYLPGETNWYYGHVAIAIGNGTEVGVTSLTDGVTQRDIYLGTGYQGWIGAEDFENDYP